MKSLPPSNFAHLQSLDQQLVRLGLLAEKYFPDDPNTCLLKLRQFAELLAQSLAAHIGLLNVPEETQYDLVRRLKTQNVLTPEVADLFDKIRVTGNQASHALRGDHQMALRAMKFSWLVGVWFHRTVKDPQFKSGPFIRSNRNSIPALMTVLTRPRELTRKQLRELLLALDAAGYTEANLATAWREMTNQEIAARIVGYIRQAAIGDALTPFDQRVDRALQKLLASQSWTTPQRQWLQKIAAQTKANLIVDRDALDDPNQLFKREGGGFQRLNKIFDGQLETVLAGFNDSLWDSAA